MVTFRQHLSLGPFIISEMGAPRWTASGNGVTPLMNFESCGDLDMLGPDSCRLDSDTLAIDPNFQRRSHDGVPY